MDQLTPPLTPTEGAPLQISTSPPPKVAKQLRARSQSPKVLNLYRPTPSPTNLREHVPPELYDINFRLPFRVLETDHVRLEPLVPSVHLAGFLALPRETWDFFGDLGPFDRESALEAIEEFREDAECLLMAVIDKDGMARGEDGFAGVYGLTECDEEMNLLFGLIVIAPRYRRTHVNTHAMYLVLSWLFDECSMLRVQYDAVTFNMASIKSALRFGFQHEGVARNLNGAVPVHKRLRGEEGRGSQDLWMASMTAEDWKSGAHEKLRGMVNRRVTARD